MCWTLCCHFVALGACMGPWPQPTTTDNSTPTTAQEASCDGLLQDAEAGIIDSSFDRDGDGAVDGSNPDCAAAYALHLLDCDDNDVARSPLLDEFLCNSIDDDCDPTTLDAPDSDGDNVPFCEDCDDNDAQRSPDQIERCWDGIDNDCDLTVDPDCLDYQGAFALDTPVLYPDPALGESCFVDASLSQFEIVWTPPETATLDNPAGRPLSFEGILSEDGSFLLESSVVIGSFGACDEYYILTGQFLDEDTFTAQFQIDFVGIPGDSWCFQCEDRLYTELTGYRLPE